MDVRPDFGAGRDVDVVHGGVGAGAERRSGRAAVIAARIVKTPHLVALLVRRAVGAGGDSKAIPVG